MAEELKLPLVLLHPYVANSRRYVSGARQEAAYRIPVRDSKKVREGLLASCQFPESLQDAGRARPDIDSPEWTAAPFQRFHLQRDDFLRQRRVAELRRELLAVGERPADEVDHDPRARPRPSATPAASSQVNDEIG